MLHPYLPHTERERQSMLSFLGLSDQEDLLRQIPAALRLQSKPDLPAGMSESELRRHFLDLAVKNANLAVHPCFLGAGIYHHHIPAVIDQLAGRSEFYTSYTPYQPEMSQGLLQSIFEFQTMIAELCGLDAANASLYDGATAVAEAVAMALSLTADRDRILVSRALHPHFRAVLQTYYGRRARLIELPLGQGRLTAEELPLDSRTAALVVGYPNFFGQIEDLASLAAAVHDAGALLIAAVNPIALGLLASPGELGTDLVAGEGQPLGIPPSLGGPGLGFIACRDGLIRRLPGRLVGQTVDGQGRRGFVLTLQTREQHIRRENASSNICTNAALGALRASIYLAVMGPEGLRETAAQCAAAARYTRQGLTANCCEPVFDGPFFHEFAVRTSKPPATINAALWRRGIIGGLDLTPYYPELGPAVLLALTEERTREEIDTLVEVMGASA